MIGFLMILVSMSLMCCSQKSNIEEKTFVFSDSAPAAWVYNPEPWTQGDDTQLPNILVVGDSISVGYLAPLTRELDGKYDVLHVNDNCRNSAYTLQNIDRWISEMPNNETILWNNGVWDSTTKEWRDTSGTPPLTNYTTTLEQYESNLIQIARKMKATGSRVVFVTTTHIIGPPFIIGNELKLNEIAKRVLPSEGVEIMDLYPISASILNQHPNQWDVHFTREANVILGQEIAKFLGVR